MTQRGVSRAYVGPVLLLIGGIVACATSRGEDPPSLPPPAGSSPAAQGDASSPDVIDATPRADPAITAIRDRVSADRILASLTTLVGFGTRNTCSEMASATHGIGAARDYLRAHFTAIPALEVRDHAFPQPGCAAGASLQTNVVAILRGSSSTRLVAIGGHYDSRTVDALDGTSLAPGANDSGSQSAVVMEVARVLAGQRFAATLVFVAFAGEEQGLHGSTAFVRDLPLLFPGARVEAMLDLDVVGGDRVANDETSLHRYRLFSPGTPREVGPSSRDGSPDDTSPSRGLMRFIGGSAARYVDTMTMAPQLREDRAGRGGDHEPFIASGVPAVRFSEEREMPAHQHTADDTLENMTPAYATRMAQVVATTAAALAVGPIPPSDLVATRARGSLGVSWRASPSAGVDHYLVAVRSVTENAYRLRVGARGTTASMPVDSEDLVYVSVAAVDAAGHESLFAYPELRCDRAGCSTPADASDVTATATAK